MPKLKIKQIYADTSNAGMQLVVDGTGTPQWETASSSQDGSTTLLGEPTDGSFTNPQYTGAKPPAVTLQSTEKVVDAIDAINTVLGLLLPNQPTAIGGQTLTLSGVSSALLASGATDNSGGSMPAAGSTVSRSTTTVSGAVPTQLGDGSTGTLTLFADGSAVSAENFAFTGATGIAKSTGVLRVANVNWYPISTPGFFMSFDASVSGYTGATGYNTLQLEHSTSGNSTIAGFVKDSLTANPTVSSVSVAQGTLTGVFSSGVQHYAATSTLSVGANISNLAGQTYSATPLSVSGPGTSLTNPGLTLPLAANTTSTVMSGQTFTVSGNLHEIIGITVTGTNPNGSGNATSSTNLLIKSGTVNGQAGKIYEDSIVAKSTTATRTYLSDASNTTDTPTALTSSAWVSTQALNVSGYLQEATIVGGIVKNDTTNYSTGYLPVGPNYSSKSASQYITYTFSQAAVSSITLNITGTYSHFWVGLPNVSNNNTISPNAINGVWWDGFVAYNGAGVPGRTGDSAAGCATGTIASGSSGSFSMTFGTQSSSNSTSNTIIVRIKLTAGQSITALSIS